MSKVFLSNIDLSGNQLLNARLENLGASPVSSLANVGRLIYNTATNSVQFDTGTTILSVTTSANAVVQGGNSFGVPLTVGTLDAFNVIVTRGGITRLTVTATDVIFRNAANTFNATLTNAVTADSIITLPPITTTLVGKTGTAAAANQIPFYADANQLATSATFTYDGTNLTFGSATVSTIRTPAGAAMISSSTTIGLTIYGLLNTVYIADSTNGNPTVFRFFNNSTGLYGLSIGVNPAAPISRLDIGGSITASAAIAKGMYIFPTLVASANSDTLIGLDINPTFTNGAFTGVQNYAARINGRVLVGTVTPILTSADINITKSAAASSSIISIENSGSGSSYSQIVLAQTINLVAAFARWNSGYAGNHGGTTVPLANTFYVSNSTNGQDGSGPITILGSTILHLVGQTGTNNGTRQDSIGFRIGTLADMNIANTVPFQVNNNLLYNGSYLQVSNSLSNQSTPILYSIANTTSTNNIYGAFYGIASNSSTSSIHNVMRLESGVGFAGTPGVGLGQAIYFTQLNNLKSSYIPQGKITASYYACSTGVNKSKLSLWAQDATDANVDNLVEILSASQNGVYVGPGQIQTTVATAFLHLAPGGTAPGMSPEKYTSGSLMLIAEVGAIEFLTDAWYGTITTGAARKTFAFLESPTFTGSVTVSGSFSLSYRLTTVATSFSSTDYTIDCTGTPFTITLPTAIGIQGRIYLLKNSSGGTKTLATTASQTIDGSTTQTRTSGNFIKVQSNNANWIIIG